MTIEKTFPSGILFPPPPVEARHIEPSLLFSADDDRATASLSMVELSLAAIKWASVNPLPHLRERIPFPPFYVSIWPGEHYRLLAGFVEVLQPRQIIEIGTGGGLSTLALAERLPPGGNITTFDIVHWKNTPTPALQENDLNNGKITFIQEDLCNRVLFEKYRPLLQSASLFFIDAAKDGSCEYILFSLLPTLRFNEPVYFILDDIRLWNMLKLWREISEPKLDLTSFGHWSGTGLVEWR